MGLRLGKNMQEFKNLSSKYKIQALTRDHLEVILDLYRSNPLYFQHCPPEPSLESVREDMVELPAGKTKKDKFYIGFWDDKELVAILDFVLSYPEMKTIFIGLFMVHQTYQGKGLGSEIIKEAFQVFSKDYQRVRLAYVKGNSQAQYFWEKQGFLPVGKVVPKANYCVVLMEKVLE